LAFIALKNVTKRFGTVVAVDHLDLQIEAGEFLTLLGPSGCGKTTVLRMISGLEIPDEGEIEINGEDVFSSETGVFVPPAKRGVGLVFQSYALWPHMNVFGNVAFGLQTQGVKKEDLGYRVDSVLDYMRLEGLGKRFPQELSGGQQQRVALARMLVTRPPVFLMDEPLSNLDAKLRMEMRTEIKRIHRESRATTIYVTHDQTEALPMSTRVAVMDRGTLQQVAPPQAIYRRPANLFVADFIGSPTINFVSGEIAKRNGGIFFKGGPLRFLAPGMELSLGKQVVAAIRPEGIQVLKEESQETFPGEIYAILPAGPEVFLQVKLGNLILNVREITGAFLEVGESVSLRFLPTSVIFYDKTTGLLLSPSKEAHGL